MSISLVIKGLKFEYPLKYGQNCCIIWMNSLSEWSFYFVSCCVCGRRGGLMVSALVSGPLVSGSSGPGSSHGRGHCVVFLGKTLY